MLMLGNTLQGGSMVFLKPFFNKPFYKSRIIFTRLYFTTGNYCVYFLFQRKVYWLQ